MEQTKQTTSQWVEDMRKWQNENKEQRAFLCVGITEGNALSVMGGYGIQLIHSLLTAVLEDEVVKYVVNAVHEATENPVKGLLIESAWIEYAKKHGIIKEEEKPDTPSIKSSLKDLFQTLADKL